MPVRLRTILVLLPVVALGGCAAMRHQLERVGTPIEMAPAADVAGFNEAVQLTSNLRYSDAIEKFDAVLPRLRATGDDERAAEAMFWMGYCYEKLGHLDGAGQWYTRVREMYPRQRVAEQAAARQARLPRNATPE